MELHLSVGCGFEKGIRGDLIVSYLISGWFTLFDKRLVYKDLTDQYPFPQFLYMH